MFKNLFSRRSVRVEEPVAVEIAEPEVVQDDSELIAVISAAIAAFTEKKGASFVVRSVRRVGVNVPAWAAIGRSENLMGR